METAPLSSEDALQQEIPTSVVDKACADEALAASELSLAKYEIVFDDATSLESKQQEILEPLPAVDDGSLSEDLPIHPGSPTTGNSMTELAPCPPPLPVSHPSCFWKRHRRSTNLTQPIFLVYDVGFGALSHGNGRLSVKRPKL
jgi:hypothetical protein